MTAATSFKQKAIRALYVSILGSFFLALLKGITGYVGNSFALIADAIESSTDVFSSLFVLAGIHYATRPPDNNHPYGHGRAEALITFAVVGFLLISATAIAIQSIQNIRTPHNIPEPFTLVVLGAVILFKETTYQYVLKKSKETGSSSLAADAWHHRSDALTSLMAFIGISIALLFGKGYETADDWAALLAAGFIVYNAFLIFRPALREIMDEHQYDEIVVEIRKKAISIEGVHGTEKCMVRKLGMHYLVDLHIEVDGELSVSEGHRIAHEVKDHLLVHMPIINEVLIHVEPAP